MTVESVEFLEIPAGWFGMGWDDGLPDARPRHPVWIDAFELGRTPVTNAEFGEFLHDARAEPPPFWTDPRFSDPEQPVVGVTWTEAVAFCDWLSRTMRRPHRLPSRQHLPRVPRPGAGPTCPAAKTTHAARCRNQCSARWLASSG